MACNIDCRNGKECVDDICVGKRCKNSQDCQAGEFCTEIIPSYKNRCIPTDCNKQSDCGPGYKCTSKKCVIRCSSSYSAYSNLQYPTITYNTQQYPTILKSMSSPGPIMTGRRPCLGLPQCFDTMYFLKVYDKIGHCRFVHF